MFSSFLRNITLTFIFAAASATPGLAYAYQINATGSTPLTFGVGSTSSTVAEKMRISSGGLVGIGTATPTSAFEVSGTISATTFVGNGSGLTNLPGGTSDNITSSTTKVSANSTGYVSVTTNGTVTNYFDTTGRLITPGISVTTYNGISTTNANVSGRLSVFSTDPGNPSMIIQNNSSIGYDGFNLNDDTGTLAGTIAYSNSGALFPGSFLIGARNATAPILFLAGSSTPTERMRITAAGLVGIGNTNPLVPLSVSQSNASFELSGSAAAKFTGPVLEAIDRTGTGRSDMNLYTTKSIKLFSGTAEMMRISTTGVGIGTSTPTAPLEVSGTVSATRFIGDGSLLTGISGGSSDNITSGSTYVQAQTGGSVLVSTSGFYINNAQGAPDAALRIGANPTANHNSYIDLVGDSTYPDGLRLIRNNSGPNATSGIRHRGLGNFNIMTVDSAPIIFAPSSTEALRIMPSGLIGIGTAAPGFQLDISGTTRFVTVNTNVSTNASTVTNNPTITTNAAYSNVGLSTGVYSTISSGITNSGNIIGINTTALNQSTGNLNALYGLNVSIGSTVGTGTITNAYGMVISSYLASGTTTQSFGLFIQDMKATNGYGIYQTGTDDTNYFAGNTGIGATTPNVALDVSGAIVSRVYNNAAATSFDWSRSNAQYTSASCGAMTFSNMQDGGTYSLLVNGTTAATCSFTHTGLTFKLPAGHGATTSGKTTLYGFTRFGTNVYVTWQPGY